MHGKNIIDGFVRESVNYEKFHLGVQDGALQRVRVKIDAMSNFLRTLGQVVDPISDRAGSRVEDNKRVAIWGTVPEHLMAVLPGLKGLYEGALVKVFTPLPPGGMQPGQQPPWNLEMAIRTMLMAGSEKWMDLGRGRDKVLLDCCQVLGKRTRVEQNDVSGLFVPERDGWRMLDNSTSLPLSVMDALLAVRDRYDVVGKSHLARETSIKQCLRCLNCSTLTGGAGTAEKMETKDEPIKSEDGTEPVGTSDSTGAEAEHAYKGPPPWSDAFGFACVCGGRWWKVAGVL